jgi:hypothetical protein
MQHTPKVSDQNPDAATNIEAVKNNLRKLQKTKNYKALGQAAGLSVEKSHCGWGWRSLDDSSIADDLPYEAEAWEAGCFESGLMEDVEQMELMLSDDVLRLLGLISK